jgi:hypothetical protein
MAKTGSRRVLSQGKTASTEEWRLVMRLKDKVAIITGAIDQAELAAQKPFVVRRPDRDRSSIGGA